MATASRVASGSAPVRPETRARVERAMRELLYVPIRRETVGAIGLLVPELGNPIFPCLAQAMEGHATAAGLASILCNTAGSTQRETNYSHMLLERRVRGMIFISSELSDTKADHSHFRRLLGEGARLVFVNGAGGDVEAPTVGVDERTAGALAVRHLLELGHRRIGFVAGPAHYTVTQEKHAGREAALRAAGIEPAGLVAHDAFSVDGGRRAARALLGLAPGDRPTGLVCSSDLMAIGALQAAADLGLRVPDELSVVGFDGIEAAEWTRPALTTVEQPVEAIAQAAVAALRALEDDAGRPHAHLRFRPTLKVRGSTASPG